MMFFDLHCDTLSKLAENKIPHITPSSLKKHDFAAQTFAIFSDSSVPDIAWKNFKNQLSTFEKMLQENSSVISRSKSQKDFVNNLSTNKISAVLSIENAVFLNNDTSNRIEFLKKSGVRAVAPVWNYKNKLGSPHTDGGGLTKLGKNIADSLDICGITVDVSHMNEKTADDVLKICKNPVIASHSCCRSLFDHSRNLTDRQIKKIGDTGGIVGVNFYSRFLNGTNSATSNDIISNIAKIIQLAGTDTPAFGSDFDGMDCELSPDGLEIFANIADRLIKLYGEKIAEKICFLNAARVLLP